MGEELLVVLAIAGGTIAVACAAACALACVWMSRPAARASTQPDRTSMRGTPRIAAVPHGSAPAPGTALVNAPVVVPPQPVYVVAVPAPQVHLTPVISQQPAYQVAAPHVAGAAGTSGLNDRSPVVLQGRYPQLGQVLGTWLQRERDDVERIRIAGDLGAIGGADSARALLDAVRTGALSPTVAADNLERGGFEAGIAVAAALRDPEPRVRALATTLVGRSTPLERSAITRHDDQ